MMKKVLLAALLLIVVVAVSYIRNVRGTSQNRASYEQGRDEVLKQLVAYEDMVDSLRYFVDRQEVAFKESLVEKELEYQQIIDSFFQVLDDAERGIGAEPVMEGDSLLQPMDTSVVDSETSPSAEPESLVYSQTGDTSEPFLDEAELAREQEILALYRKLYDDLPKDLSTYERRVSLYEIRLKTAQEFSISLAELKGIRSRNALTY